MSGSGGAAIRRRLASAFLASGVLAAAACTRGGAGGVAALDPGSASELNEVEATPSAPPPTSTAGTTAPPTTLAPTTTVPLDPTEQWLLDLAASGAELPGGGTTVFPDRRIVAFYGSPVTFRLGVLGERSAQRGLEVLAELAADYEAAMPEGQVSPPVVPAFELIATVADWKPGDDGDYSNELDIAELEPWVDAATEAGGFVIIDLQPGRTDFLTQARRYESLLRRPNVGLALDPEWRLGPEERHMVQIGSVGAAEINEVVDWLVDIVREEALPQKILVLHQFQEAMLPDRHLVETPPELAVVVHVDGQGPLGSKYGTYDEMVEALTGPEQTLWWGWKNFYDEDFPVATPGQVNAVDPLPVVITFQ